jgi:hypothetical protein
VNNTSTTTHFNIDHCETRARGLGLHQLSRARQVATRLPGAAAMAARHRDGPLPVQGSQARCGVIARRGVVGGVLRALTKGPGRWPNPSL